MSGLDPGIHVLLLSKTRMAGSSPAMTSIASLVCLLILPDGQITQKSVQPLLRKYSSWPLARLTSISIASCPTQRGVGHVTDAGRVAVDAVARETGDAKAYGEVVWF